MRLLVPKDEAPAAAAKSPAPSAKGRGRTTAPARSRGRKNAAAMAADSSVAPSELAARREELASEFAELQWDLGGLVYEMAARDHFRLDVVVRRAARLQAVDSELAEVDRLLRLEEAGAAGSCPACGALYARGAAFCWQCGKNLMPAGAVSTEPVGAPPQPSLTPTEAVAERVAAVEASQVPIPPPGPAPAESIAATPPAAAPVAAPPPMPSPPPVPTPGSR